MMSSKKMEEAVLTDRELVFLYKKSEKQKEETRKASHPLTFPEPQILSGIITEKTGTCLKAFLALGLFFALHSQMLYAQSTYLLLDSTGEKVKLSGTSTLHDWSMATKKITANAQFLITGGVIKAIPSFALSIPVENLKSNEGALDKNAYKALKSTEYKDIVFTLTSSSIERNQASGYLVKVLGNLNIAGVTKEITLNVYCEVKKDKSIACNTSKKLSMSDYKVDPPVFMMGLMKTGDLITLEFNLAFKNKGTSY